MKPRIFTIGDIHGAGIALAQCLERCGFDFETDTLISLGDYVDGWSDVYSVVEQLLSIKNLIPIMGNHDEWFRDYIMTGIHPVNWRMGGEATARSYLREYGKDQLMKNTGDGWLVALNPGDIPETHKKFFRTLHYWYEFSTEKYRHCFVHGGFDPEYGIELQHPSMLMWDRNLWQHAQNVDKGKIIDNINNFNSIFIGHTHVDTWRNPKALPLTEGGVTNLDTGAGWGGKLTIMDVNTRYYWQSDNVKTLYPDELGRRSG